MGNVKDEAKKMDPLFPRLHISDADKGGPRTPPRNKMALPQQLSLPLHTTQRCLPGSVSPILTLSTNNANPLVPASSSYHDASYKRSVFSSFDTSCGSTRLATRLDSYHSSAINLNISLTTVKKTIETTNCQTLCNAGHLKRNDYRLFKPQDYKTMRNTTNLVKKLDQDEDDYLVPSLSFGSGQHTSNRGKFPLQAACRKHTDKDATQENKLNSMIIKDNLVKEPIPCYSDRVQLLSEELATSNLKKRSILVDEPQSLHEFNISLPLKRKSFQEPNIANKDVISIEPEQSTRKMSTSMWPSLGDNSKTDRAIQEDVEKIGDISKTNFVSGYNITPEEVSQMIGPEQYFIARKTIVQQQRLFQYQLFELHRLIKVQKQLAESPDLLLEDMKMPSSEEAFPNVDPLKKERFRSLPTNNTIIKPFLTNINSIDLPLPSTVFNGAVKQPPLCVLPAPGNQWLVPVRSPSEGLVYKPYAGPCPPPVGLMAPVYGMPSNGDTGLLNINSAYNNIPTLYQQGLGVYSNNGPLFSSYGLPRFTKRCCSPDKWAVSSGEFVESEDDNKNNSNKESRSCERKRGGGGDHELPLFPTRPMAMAEEGCNCTEDEQRIKVIKVVPHNPKVASQSAARIFQFIQEERQTK